MPTVVETISDAVLRRRNLFKKLRTPPGTQRLPGPKRVTWLDGPFDGPPGGLDSAHGLLADLLGPMGQDQEHIAKLRQRISAEGTEAIAFYRPFHYLPFEGSWGIYFQEGALFDLAEEARRADRKRPDDAPRYFRALLAAVRQHELFHFRNEVLALTLEQPGQKRLFLRYAKKVYRPTLGTADCVEEALANAASLLVPFRDSDLIRPHLERIYAVSPPGYKDYANYLPAAANEDGIGLLTAQLITGVANPPPVPVRTWFPLASDQSVASAEQVPQYLLLDPRISQDLRGILLGLLVNRMSDVFRFCKKKCNAIVEAGGRHSAVRFPSGRKVPFSSSWPHPPMFFLDQLAEAAGMPRREFIEGIRAH